MIKDLLVSFKDNIKTKTTNPFFGTLIVVWIFHNWRLIYSVFNFEVSTKLETRIAFLAEYLDSKNLVPDLLYCILITVIILIITYILLNLSRLIVNFFEKVITPKVYQWTDKSSIVLKSDFVILRNERDRFEKKFEQERDSRLKMQNEYEQLETRLKNALSSDQSKNKPEKSSDNIKNIKLKELLENQETLNAFREMVDIILNKNYVPDSKTTKLMLRLNLVEKLKSNLQGFYTYAFTPDGKKLREMLIDYDIPSNKN